MHRSGSFGSFSSVWQKLFTVGTLAAFVSTTGVARASNPPPKIVKKEADIAATQTALSKPTQASKDDKKKPTIQIEDIFGGLGEQVKSVTDEQVKVLKRLIDSTGDDDPEKPDLMYRMAGLYAEQQRYYNFRARDLDQKIFVEQQKNNAAGADKLKATQADYLKREQQWLLAAVKQYLEVADGPKFTSYKRMDEVLFYLAYLLTEVKKEEAARKYFKRLIKDFPKSKFIPDALFAFGEYFFEQKQLEDALTFYDKVLQFPESRVFGYAKYKKGWVYYNLGDFKGALATFVEVIEMTEKGGGSSTKAGRIALNKEAKKDSVRAYARVGTPDKAWPFFQRVGGDYAPTMMEVLAELYNGQGQFDDSIKIFRELMKLFKDSPKLCFWQNEVLRNTLSRTGAKAHPDNVKELQRLAAVYDKFANAKNLKQDTVDECRDNTAGSLRELATVWHKEAQKTKDKDVYSLAQYLYKEYLKNFPKEKDIYLMTFYYAELLFTLGAQGETQKYCEAAPIYTKVVELDPDPKAKWLKEAAYAAVISWKNCLEVADDGSDVKDAQQKKREELKNAKAGKGKTATKEEAPKTVELTEKPIPENKQKMIAAFDTYIKYVPAAPELPKIKWNKIRIYYDYNHFDEAIPLLQDLVDNYAADELGIYAMNLLLDCLAAKKDYKTISKVADICLAKQEFNKDAQLKQLCGSIKAGIKRKEIEQLEDTKNYREAAIAQKKLAEDNPTDPKWDEIVYNSAINFERAHLIGSAIVMRELLIEKKPDSPLAKKAIYQVGRNYQDVVVFDRSADKFETFASKYPGEKEASTALFTASFFRRGLGDNDKSIADTNLFVKNYGARKEFTDQAAGVNFGEGQIYEQAKDWDKLVKHFRSYLTQWGTKGGVDRQIIAHVKMGEVAWRQSCPVAGVNGACIDLTRIKAGGAAKIAAAAKAKMKGKKGKKKKGADLPPQCGPETKSKIVLHERKPLLVKEAMTHFDAAITLFNKGLATKQVPGKDETEKNARIADMSYFVAQAKMAKADLEYEKLLAIKVPDKLDFSPAPPGASAAKQAAVKKRMEEAKKKFADYLKAKDTQLQNAAKQYQQVILLAQAHWAIAAAARIGQLYQDFSGQLYTAPVPKAGTAPGGVEQDEWEQLFHDAYCDQLTDAAEPLETKAVEGLSTCLSSSTKLSWFNEWSQLCEAELAQIKPGEFSIAAEIRAEPGYSSVASDRAEPLTESKE